MGHIVLRAAPDDPRYIIWSDIVEAPIAGPGTRAATLEYLTAEWRRHHGADVPPAALSALEARLARADAHGTSDMSVREGEYADEFLIYEQRGLLPRARIAEATELLNAGRDSEVWDMMQPFEDQEEVRRG